MKEVQKVKGFFYKKKISLSADEKRAILNLVNRFSSQCSTPRLLKLINLHSSTYGRWKADLKGCQNTSDGLCGKKSVNQLTEKEQSRIFHLATSDDYSHFSLTALWKYACRNGEVVCSVDTWFKYIKLFGIRRKPVIERKIPISTRASRVNEIWHLDLTIIKLTDGTPLYLQVLVDNYSRFVIDWALTANKKAKNTSKLLNSALSDGSFFGHTKIFMDQGSENRNRLVDKVFCGRRLKRVFANVGEKSSNSIVESFFRSLKNNFIYQRKFHDLKELEHDIRFYIRQHNDVIPHNAFVYETPREIYKNIDVHKSLKELKSLKEKAREKRMIENRKYDPCNNCEMT